ncbi:MAG: fumarate reductase/succinate dehydrogenase flavoprotein subunit, partial [Candidatus Zixiibacteriota bacterium]
TMGGLWVDYNLESNLNGLFVIGEANFSDHGANRLGASALMQGLADGYFIIPYTMGNFLAREGKSEVNADHSEFKLAEAAVRDRVARLLSINGKETVDSFHRRLGQIMWDKCGMARSRESLESALKEIPALREEFWHNVRVLGTNEELNQSLEKAGRVADFLEFAEVMCYDALRREESCGAHFRVEYQTEEGEAKRNDKKFMHVACWEYKGDGKEPELHKEPLEYTVLQPATRSYK